MSPNTTEHHQSLRECPSRPLWLPLSPRRDLHRGSSSHHGCSRRRPSETSNRHRRRQEANASYCIITFRNFHGMSRESRVYIVIACHLHKQLIGPKFTQPDNPTWNVCTGVHDKDWDIHNKPLQTHEYCDFLKFLSL